MTDKRSPASAKIVPAAKFPIDPPHIQEPLSLLFSFPVTQFVVEASQFQSDRMSSSNDVYQTPLNSRYSSKSPHSFGSIDFADPGFGLMWFMRIGNEMKYLFSARNRFSTWRQLWLWLAESQKGIIVQ